LDESLKKQPKIYILQQGIGGFIKKDPLQFKKIKTHKQRRKTP